MNVEEKVVELVEKDLANMGLEIVRVRLLQAQGKILEILLARIDGEPVSIAECQTASQHMSVVFDVEDLISNAYKLEVSSAGVERPLVKIKDFEKFAGKVIDIRFFERVEERKSYRAELKGIREDEVLFVVDDKEMSVPFENIKSANIALTDELFREILNKKKNGEEHV